MIKLSFAVVVAMLCSDYAIADATTDRSADTAELTRLAIESGRAYARRDLATLEQFTAQDYVQTDVRGGILNRAEWLEFVKNRKSDLTVDSDESKFASTGMLPWLWGIGVYIEKHGP